MGEYALSDRPEDILWTFALASCVAVTVYCPLRKAAGMIHLVLPAPLRDRDAAKRPEYYAETGVPLLIGAMCAKFGCRADGLRIQMYGGADPANRQDVYRVGEKNISAVKHSLLGMGLTLQKADLRGRESRTLEMRVETGAVTVFRQQI